MQLLCCTRVRKGRSAVEQLKGYEMSQAMGRQIQIQLWDLQTRRALKSCGVADSFRLWNLF